MKRLAFALLLLLNTLAYAGEKVLYTFQGGADGFQPNASLVQDEAGHIYGTTYYGGDLSCVPSDGCGTVFELSPDGHGGWTEAVLYRFAGGADGQNPLSGLILDGQGNLYGTTFGVGGDSCAPHCGSAFELSPGLTGWTFTVLHAFKGKNDGGDVDGGLTMDEAGNLYGTTRNFGPKGYGTVFRLSNSGSKWTLKTLRAFDLDILADGLVPAGTLIRGSDGAVYGVTLYGGLENFDDGVFYKLFQNAKGNWKEKVLYSFGQGTRDGSQPVGLSTDKNFNLYGVTPTPSWGHVFRFTENRSGKWSRKTLYSFGGQGGNASIPSGGVLVDQDGNVFGAAGGGIGSRGTLYELTPQANGKFVETLLYSFQGGSDGIGPNGPPIMDASGNLYGVTAAGGGGCSAYNGCGTVFEFTP